MSLAHILLVDDEPSLIGVLTPVLSAAGYEVTTAGDVRGALEAAVQLDPDVVLLDLGLPDGDGKDVIRHLRLRSEVPIIVISARHQEQEKVIALDEGADDFVNKPFEIGELMARVRAALRRRSTQASEATGCTIGEFAIDFVSRRVTISGEAIKLSPKEHDLLTMLARNAGRVVTHKRLLAVGWGMGASDTQYLRVYIGLLRQKIEEDSADPKLIVTEPGVGYRLKTDS